MCRLLKPDTEASIGYQEVTKQTINSREVNTSGRKANKGS